MPRGRTKVKLVENTNKTRRRVVKKNTPDLSDNIDYGLDGEDVVPDLDDDNDADNDVDVETEEKTELTERYEYQPVVRKEIVYVTPENRVTSEIMTRYEYTEVISIRAKHIEDGGQCFTDVGNITDPIEMAEKELRDRKCPLDITRMLSDNVAELWHVNEMGFTEE